MVDLHEHVIYTFACCLFTRKKTLKDKGWADRNHMPRPVATNALCLLNLPSILPRTFLHKRCFCQLPILSQNLSLHPSLSLSLSISRALSRCLYLYALGCVGGFGGSDDVVDVDRTDCWCVCCMYVFFSAGGFFRFIFVVGPTPEESFQQHDLI